VEKKTKEFCKSKIVHPDAWERYCWSVKLQLDLKLFGRQQAFAWFT